ncbi:MAG: thioredoxin-like domain-containing protein [Spirochaetales bacterium]
MIAIQTKDILPLRRRRKTILNFFLILFLLSSFTYAFGNKEKPAELPSHVESPKTSESTKSAETMETSRPNQGTTGSPQMKPEATQAPSSRRSYAGVIPAPEFPEGMNWLNVKEPLQFSKLKGKIVLLDFWTYGCINCMHNIPYIKQLQEEYPNELVVIGIHSAKFANEGRLQSLRNILLRYGITYPVVNDPEFEIWQLWGPQAWPTLVLVDPAGKVSAATMGEGFYPQFKEIIQSLKEEFTAKGVLDTRPWKPIFLKPETRSPTLLTFPGKVRVDPSGNRLYVADSGNNRILRIDIETGNILARVGSGGAGFRDGSFQIAEFRNPQGMAVSPDGNTVYVADTGNHAIRKINFKTGQVSTLAGTGKQSVEYPPVPGQGPNLPLSSPWDLELAGNTLYIAMAGSHQLWVMNLSSRELLPFSGSGAEGYTDGPSLEAELAQPSGLSLDPRGRLYFADSEGSSIRYVELKDSRVGTLAGSGNSLFDFGAVDAVGTEARFQHPLGVRFHNGKVYVSDTYNHRIRVIDPNSAEVITLSGVDAGFKDGQDARWDEPGGLDARGNRLYVADTNNHVIRWIDLLNGTVHTLFIKEPPASQSRVIPRSTKSQRAFIPIPVQFQPGATFPGSELLFSQPTPPIRFRVQEVSSGRGELSLLAELPKGYKPSAEAFSTLTIQSTGEAARFLGASPLSLQAPSFPIRIPFEFRRGTGEVVIEAAIAYCSEEGEGICYIDRRRIEVPIQVTEGKGREIMLRYSLPLTR